MDWPDPLIKEISARRCIIFLGAGASIGCQNDLGQHPPDWKLLLTQTASKFVKDNSDLEIINDLIEEKQYLDAAEIIFSYIDPAEEDQFLRETFLRPGYHPTKLHELILTIDPKIVITTNYDQIYESQFPGGRLFVVKKYHEEGILDEIRSPVRLLIKAHGCVTFPKNIVITRSQYYKAKSKYPSFFSLLYSLFLTNTVLFIGCSLEDPDIQLILANSKIAVPSSHPHYALIPKTTHHVLVKAIRLSYNIRLLEFDTTENITSDVIQLLESLRDSVLANRELMRGDE